MNVSTLTIQRHKPHINQLLTTAATGAGVVGDVDALLTPIQPKLLTMANSGGSAGINMRYTSSPNLDARPERNLWHKDEIMLMLNIMQNTGAVELLNDKSIKSDSIFLNVERIMQKNGYRRKSYVQIRTKWKFLKSTYNTNHRNGTIPKMISMQIYTQLHKMLSNPSNFGSGSAHSATNSECDNSRDGELIISGVEGGYGDNDTMLSADMSDSAMDVANETNSFEHPIFGFRLGVVKQEPTDAGYETNAENSAQAQSNTTMEKKVDPFENVDNEIIGDSGASNTSQIQFRTEIKEEPEEHFDSVAIVNRPIPNPSSSSQVAQMPPLRVAPFAKERQSKAFEQELQDRPPPPLLMHPGNDGHGAARHLNRVNLKEHAKATMRRIPPQNRSMRPASSLKFSPIHLSDEITLKPRNAIQSRNLRSTMPPPSYGSSEGSSSRYNGSSSSNSNDLYVTPIQPSTSRQAASTPFSLLNRQSPAQQLASNIRKRRLNIDVQDSKVTRFDGNHNPTAPTKLNYQQSSQYQQHRHPQSPQVQQQSDLFDVALKNLGTSLRQVQREWMSNFFANQMELARKEHEFQMQQDLKLMQAFSEQTRQLMEGVSELLNSEGSSFQTEEDATTKVDAANDEDDNDQYDDGNSNSEMNAEQPMNVDKGDERPERQTGNNECTKQDDIDSASLNHIASSPNAERVEANSVNMTETRDGEESGDEICVYYQDNNNHLAEDDDRNEDTENEQNACADEEGVDEERVTDEADANNAASVNDDEEDDNNEYVEDGECEEASYLEAQSEDAYEIEASESCAGSEMNGFHMQSEQEQGDLAEDDNDLSTGESNID